MIPAGRLREFSVGSKRAGLIIVSKSPNPLSNRKRNEIIKELKPEDNQAVYFSFINYGEIIAFTKGAKEILEIEKTKTDIILLTGIAKPEPLLNKVSKEFNSTAHIKFSDHHSFNNSDITYIKTEYNTLKGINKIIITTEKDIMRLSLPSILNEIQDIPIFYVPIEVCFHDNDKKEFDKKILDYVTTN